MRVLLVLALSVSSALANPSDVLSITVGGKTSEWSVESLSKRLKPVEVTVNDPVYGKKMVFEGFPLLDVLELSGVDPKGRSDEIVFTAKDGYAPNTAFENLRKHHAFLVVREKGKKGFDDVRQGKAMLSPAPFYVVWDEGKEIEHEVPWPYQLVGIEVVDFAKKYPGVFPRGMKADSAAMRGFKTFKSECLRCHSINLQGGDVGPELNIPKNVTEYWDRGTLKAFISDVSKFRMRSKMPPFPQLRPEQVDDLLSYFDAMKARKEKP